MIRCVVRVVDVETTGFDPKVDGIVEIACCDALVVEGDEFKIIMPAIARLCNPGIPIPPTARAIHHISDAMVAAAPSARELAAKALLALPSTSDAVAMPIAFAAHNAPFDRGFLEAATAGVDGLTVDPQWIDTCRLARKLWPQAPGYGNQVLRYHLFPEWPFQGSTHRAKHDVEVTTHLLATELLALRDLIIDGRPPLRGISDLVAFIAEPIDLTDKPIGFGKHDKLTWREAREQDRGYLQWMIREHNKQLEETGTGAWDPDEWYTIRSLMGYGL